MLLRGLASSSSSGVYGLSLTPSQVGLSLAYALQVIPLRFSGTLLNSSRFVVFSGDWSVSVVRASKRRSRESADERRTNQRVRRTQTRRRACECEPATAGLAATRTFCLLTRVVCGPAEKPKQGRVEFKDVELRYRDNLPLVLKGLTFDVQPQDKVGVCGRTGAGMKENYL